MTRRLVTVISIASAALLLLADTPSATAATLVDRLEEAVRERAALPAAAHVTISDVRASDRSDPSFAQVAGLTLPEGERGIGLVAARVELFGADGSRKSTWIRARVRVQAPALVASRPLTRGTVVRDGDVETAMVPLRADYVASPQLALGRELQRAVRPGDPIRARWLRAPLAVERGALVRAVVRRGAVVAEADAEAMADAAPGDVIRVRMVASGRTVRGRVVDARRVEVVR